MGCGNSKSAAAPVEKAPGLLAAGAEKAQIKTLRQRRQEVFLDTHPWGFAEAAARRYIEGTHGSLPEIDPRLWYNLLAGDVTLYQEERKLGLDEIKVAFQGWASIIEGRSWIKIHSIADAGNGIALAHWETNYNVKPTGMTWYGTSVDISGKQVRGFTVFASFRLNDDDKIVEIIQRSDDVVRKLGIEDAVYEDRKKQAQ